MGSAHTLDVALVCVAGSQPSRAAGLALTAFEQSGDAAMVSLASFARFAEGEHETVRELASRLPRLLHPTPAGQAVSFAARGLAAAGSPDADPEPILLALVDSIGRLAGDDRWTAFAHYLALEALLTNARLDLATTVLQQRPAFHESWEGHPFAPVMRICAARIRTFAGDVNGAATFLAEPVAADAVGCAALATQALISGNAADVDTVRQIVARLHELDVQPTDHLTRGTFLLTAFGLMAIGEERTAAQFVLAAGGADLHQLTVVDRALGFELLATIATRDQDGDSAHTWLERMLGLERHPAATPAVWRTRARIALLELDTKAAQDWATRATDLAYRHSRVQEAAESEGLLGRGLILDGHLADATRLLSGLVRQRDSAGHLAVRRSAGQILGAARRRLPPVRGGGWEALTDREAEIARLVLSGHDDVQIARRLFLSPATVRTHASRILVAFGVASRVGLLAVAGAQGDDLGASLAELTDRQQDVVALVAKGWSNAEIAAELAISVKAVEKHVTSALARWQISSRVDLARQYLLARERRVDL